MSGPRNPRLGMAVLTGAAVMGLLSARLPEASQASAPTIKDPSALKCPPAPNKWATPRTGGTMLQDSQTTPRLGPSYQVILQCRYVDRHERFILIELSYTMPTDPNPNADFDLGCDAGNTAWNNKDRVFRVASSDQWAIASFYDPNRELDAVGEHKFEQITRTLLQSAQGYAHGCSLRVEPSTVVSHYSFTFQAAAGRAAGSFWIKGVPNSTTNAIPIVRVQAPKIILFVQSKAVRYKLTLRITQGIDYRHAKHGFGESTRFGLKVISSKLPACQPGANGVLTVSTKPALSLDVCGRTFLRGHARTTISYLG